MNGETKILVGWTDTSHPDHHSEKGYGQLAHDPSRIDSPFLVSSLTIAENEGPNDTLPDLRLALDVKCLRLTDTFMLLPDAEEIWFSQYEPMSIAQPNADEIELIGFAKMPAGLENAG